MAKQIFMIAGPNGAGKTTTAASFISRKQDIHEILLEAHRKGIEQAMDLSIRTGVPLVVEENGKIKQIKPKYKYTRSS